jgi:hypothetical protein
MMTMMGFPPMFSLSMPTTYTLLILTLLMISHFLSLTTILRQLLIFFIALLFLLPMIFTPMIIPQLHCTFVLFMALIRYPLHSVKIVPSSMLIFVMWTLYRAILLSFAPISMVVPWSPLLICVMLFGTIETMIHKIPLLRSKWLTMACIILLVMDFSVFPVPILMAILLSIAYLPRPYQPLSYLHTL